MRPGPPIRAVTFDAGGTLIEPWPSVGQVYAEVAAHHGIKGLSAKQLNQQFAAAWQARGDFDYSRAAWFELVRRTFGEAGTALADDFFSEVFERFAEPDVWRIYPDVLPALAELTRCGLRLAVLSNWDERLHPLLRRLKLADYFEVVVISADIGFTKPSPVIFEHTARTLGLPPAAILHVGDSNREDVDGATRAGFGGCLLERGISRQAGAINSLRELISIICPPSPHPPAG